MFDRFSLVNFNREELKLSLGLSFDADFVDVFQVRGAVRSVHGQYYRPVWRGHCLSFFYHGLDGVLRQTRIEMKPGPSHQDEKNALWEIRLPPMKHYEIEVTVIPVVGEAGPARAVSEFDECLRERRDRFAEWQHNSTHFSSNHSILDTALNTAIGDFHALQISDGNEHVVGAGIPCLRLFLGAIRSSPPIRDYALIRSLRSIHCRSWHAIKAKSTTIGRTSSQARFSTVSSGRDDAVRRASLRSLLWIARFHTALSYSFK